VSQSRQTINIQCQYVADWGKTLDFLRKLDPVAVVACIDSMNAKNRVFELQQALPNTRVIGRFVFGNDGGMHLKPLAAGDNREYVVSPTDALNAWGELGKDGRTLYLLNEPQANGALQDDISRLVRWMLEALNIATERGISLCIANFGVGHPALMGNGEYDARFDDVLNMLSKRRDTHSLGMHVYQPADTFTRLDGLIKRCKSLGITPPRVHITEAGFDAASGGDALNGYKSRGYSGSQFAAFQIDKLKNVYSAYIVDDVLQSVATFCWGNDASWKAFNVENDTDWQSTILTAKDAGNLTFTKKSTAPLTQPDYEPIAFTVGNKYTLQSADNARTKVRTAPIVSTDNQIGLLDDKTIVKLYEVQQLGIDYWYRLSTDTIQSGWISGRGGMIGFIPYLEQSPVIVLPTPPANPPPVAGKPSAYARLYAAQLKVAQAEFELAQLYKQLDEESQLSNAA